MNTPWRVSETGNSRVSILDVDGHVMTEVLPSQKHGRVVTQGDRIVIASYIVKAVNAYADAYAKAIHAVDAALKEDTDA